MVINTPSRIAVAMSGGVDSSVAAAILSRQGHEVLGITMVNTRSCIQPAENNERPAVVRAARKVAQRLNIPHIAVELSNEFDQEIVTYFVEEYLAGRTPNPCVRCNRRVKFGFLFEHARRMGADYLATGHYARLEERSWGVALLRGADPAKDQSYMLANLMPEHLGRAVFPLGNQTKTDTRAMAQELGISDAHLADSQEVCFVPGDDYGRFVSIRAGTALEPGPILNSRGERLGTHRGLVHYTVGQRKGLGIAAERPLYVLRIVPEQNTLIVGFEEETLCRGLDAVDVNWLVTPAATEFACEVQIRYRQRPVPCHVTVRPGSFTVIFDVPVRSVAPGQWAALFDGDLVLGGGIIHRALPLLDSAVSVRE